MRLRRVRRALARRSLHGGNRFHACPEPDEGHQRDERGLRLFPARGSDLPRLELCGAGAGKLRGGRRGGGLGLHLQRGRAGSDAVAQRFAFAVVAVDRRDRQLRRQRLEPVYERRRRRPQYDGPFETPPSAAPQGEAAT